LEHSLQIFKVGAGFSPRKKTKISRNLKVAATKEPKITDLVAAGFSLRSFLAS
jgi:hypothetical protein